MFSARKTFSSLANATNLKNTSAVSLSAILIGGLFLFSTTNNNLATAQIMIVPIEDIAENCELKWYWDDRTGQLAARLDSQIVVTSATDGIIEGKITAKGSSNHTLHMYDDESVIMAQFGYDSGFRGDSYMAAKPSNGVFTIDIPAEYADADYVKLWVNGNSFVMQPPQQTSESSSEISSAIEEEDNEEEATTTTITSATNSTTTTTTITKSTETDPATNSTIITITTVTEITPVEEESESTTANSTTTVVTTITTTVIDPSRASSSETTTTTETKSVSDDIAEEEPQQRYVIGANMTLHDIAAEVPQNSDYWVPDYVTLFFQEDYFMLDKRPMIVGEYEDIDDYEDNHKVEHTEVHQTQITVAVSSASLKYEL